MDFEIPDCRKFTGYKPCHPGENGETWKSCRHDCKPIGRAILWFVFGLLILTFVYLGLQIWYRKHYEAYLFEDSAQLYNLLMYISNARAHGMQDAGIAEGLKSKGWNDELVVYAMKKSRGERIGMFEIIPLEKVLAWIRDLRARRKG